MKTKKIKLLTDSGYVEHSLGADSAFVDMESGNTVEQEIAAKQLFVNCSTNANIQFKEITLNNVYLYQDKVNTIIPGSHITINFEKGNTAISPKLRITKNGEVNYNDFDIYLNGIIVNEIIWSENTIIDLVYDGNKFQITSTSREYYEDLYSNFLTADFNNWEEIEASETPITATLYSVAYGVDKFVAVGCTLESSDTGTIIYSTDEGLTWTVVSRTLSPQFKKIKYIKGYFVAFGDNNTFSYSTDGVSWTHLTGLTYKINDIAFGNGSFVMVGVNIIYYAKTNLLPTTINGWLSVLVNGTFSSVAYGNGSFLTIPNGTSLVYKSSEGSNWAYQSFNSYFSSNFNYNISFENGYFIVCSNNISGSTGSGSICSSVNGVEWTVASAANIFTGFWDICFGDGNTLVFGYNNALITSNNNTLWTYRDVDINNNPGQRNSLRGGTFNKKHTFVLVGDYGCILVSKPLLSAIAYLDSFDERLKVLENLYLNLVPQTNMGLMNQSQILSTGYLATVGSIT